MPAPNEYIYQVAYTGVSCPYHTGSDSIEGSDRIMARAWANREGSTYWITIYSYNGEETSGSFDERTGSGTTYGTGETTTTVTYVLEYSVNGSTTKLTIAEETSWAAFTYEHSIVSHSVSKSYGSYLYSGDLIKHPSVHINDKWMVYTYLLYDKTDESTPTSRIFGVIDLDSGLRREYSDADLSDTGDDWKQMAAIGVAWRKLQT